MKKTKKILCTALLATQMLGVLSPMTTFAQEVKDLNLKVDGKKVEFTVAPENKEGTTYVYAQDIADTLGMHYRSVYYDGEGVVYEIRTANMVLTYKMNSNKVEVYKSISNETDTKEFSTPCFDKDGKIMVPLRATLELANRNVKYNKETKEIVAELNK